MINATEYIKEHIKPKEVLEYFGFRNIIEYEDEIRACCEIHKGDNPNAFVWKKSNNLWFCYTGENCGGGDIFDLIMKMIPNISFKESITKAAAILNLDIEGMNLDISENRIRNEQKVWLTKQRNSTNIQKSQFIYSIINEPSECRFHRFDDKTLSFYNAKSVQQIRINETIFKDKLIIPIRFNDEEVALALRDLTGNYAPKWLYQPRGVKLSHKFYNYDRVNRLIEEDGIEEVILVEGIFDVWAYHKIGIDNVLAIFGSNISKEQYEILMKLNIKITLSFDNDDAGNKATNKAIDMFLKKTEYSVIRLPKGKDPADCSEEELMNCYINRRSE